MEISSVEEFISGYWDLIQGLKGQLYLRPPAQNPVFLNSYTNSVFLHSRKRPAPVMDSFFSSRGFPRTRPSTVVKQTNLVTVLEAILTSRQPSEKLQCLYENLMSSNSRKCIVNWNCTTLRAVKGTFGKRCAHQVTGHLTPESFHPGYLAPYSRTSNIIFEACLFRFMGERTRNITFETCLFCFTAYEIEAR